MREIHELLNKRWVLKQKDPDIYFKLKDKYSDYKEFFREKLGYSIIINPLLIKAEKIPGKAQPWMGIEAFSTPLSYVFLCLILMFLEEKEPEEQFVLAEVTDYIKNQYPGEESIDWTVFTKRKTLIKVLRFFTEEGMIIINDGTDTMFSKTETSMEVLYQNTGASKYFMRRFAFDISDVKNVKDIEDLEWQKEERDRGVIRRQRVYRRLVMEPVTYQEVEDDQDYLYIRKQRSSIEFDIERYLEGHFHLHKNGAMVMLQEGYYIKDCLPSRKNISDIVLQTCRVIQQKLKEEQLQRDQRDIITLSRVAWDLLIQEVIDTYGEGWSKMYRELNHTQLKHELNTVMSAFGMIRCSKDNSETVILPASGKLTGNYSKEYWKKKGCEGNGTMAD